MTGSSHILDPPKVHTRRSRVQEFLLLFPRPSHGNDLTTVVRTVIDEMQDIFISTLSAVRYLNVFDQLMFV
jgi:hypothetical protein